jgi:ribosome-binding protein aMBF1 (putative translation factor)
LVREVEADARKAAYMQQARKRLADALYADEPETLSALRLAAGLSQAQLAERASTSQPHITRIEKGQTDPGTDLIARIAAALGIDDMRVYRAIRIQLATRADPA